MLSDFLFYKALLPASGGGESGGGWNVIHHTIESVAGLPSVDMGMVIYKVSDDTPTVEQLKQGWFGCCVTNMRIYLLPCSIEGFIIEQGDLTAIALPESEKLGAIIAHKDVPEMGLSAGIYFSEQYLSYGDDGVILIYPV